MALTGWALETSGVAILRGTINLKGFRRNAVLNSITQKRTSLAFNGRYQDGTDYLFDQAAMEACQMRNIKERTEAKSRLAGDIRK